MSDTWAMVLMTLVMVAMPAGGVAWGTVVGPALRARAQRKHELALERVKLEQAQLAATQQACTSCGHGLGMHEQAMRCQEDVPRAVQWSQSGVPIHYDQVPCKCTEYTGEHPGLTGTALRELRP